MVSSFRSHMRVNSVVYEFANGYLDKHGWLASLDVFARNRDEYIPWITYPALRQLSRIVRPDWRVFEYGCGGSSLWWAKRVKDVVSVEHDMAWAERTAGYGPPNLSIVARPQGEACAPERHDTIAKFLSHPPELPLSDEPEHNLLHGLVTDGFAAYATEITAHPRESFDVVVVDGMARVLCAWLAARYVKPAGVIVFDNSDRWQYNSAFRILSKMGFQRIDYYGPGPVHPIEWCTSFFVRDLSIFSGSVESPPGDGDLGW